MSRVCHECGGNVENPFYTASAVLRDSTNNRIAFSDMETSLCYSDFERIREDLHKNPKDMRTGLGIAVDRATGVCGGSNGSVQISSGVYDRHGRHQFLDFDVAAQKLQRSVKSLSKSPKWLESDGEGGWNKAPWAAKLYEQVIARPIKQSKVSNG